MAGTRAQALRCKNHPPLTAKYFCEQCDAPLCTLCVDFRDTKSCCTQCFKPCRMVHDDDVERMLQKSAPRVGGRASVPPQPQQPAQPTPASTSGQRLSLRELQQQRGNTGIARASQAPAAPASPGPTSAAARASAANLPSPRASASNHPAPRASSSNLNEFAPFAGNAAGARTSGIRAIVPPANAHASGIGSGLRQPVPPANAHASGVGSGLRQPVPPPSAHVPGVDSGLRALVPQPGTASGLRPPVPPANAPASAPSSAMESGARIPPSGFRDGVKPGSGLRDSVPPPPKTSVVRSMLEAAATTTIAPAVEGEPPVMLPPSELRVLSIEETGPHAHGSGISSRISRPPPGGSFLSPASVPTAGSGSRLAIVPAATSGASGSRLAVPPANATGASSVTRTLPRASAVLPPAKKADAGCCGNHPDKKAARRCTNCDKSLCTECVKELRDGSLMCLACNGFTRELKPIDFGIAEAPAKVDYASTFVYPFTGEGLLILIMTAIILWLAGLGPGLGRGMALALICGYMVRIIKTSATGQDLPPGFPGATAWYDDVVIPTRLAACATIAYLLPAIIFFFAFPPRPAWDIHREQMAKEMSEERAAERSKVISKQGDVGHIEFLDGPLTQGDKEDEAAKKELERTSLTDESDGMPELSLSINPFFWVLLFGGLFMIPMATLAVSLFRTLEALHPAFLIQSIGKLGGDYFIAYFVLCLATVIEIIAKLIGKQFLFGGLLTDFGYVYFMMVQGRVLGLVYRVRETELGWFKPQSHVEDEVAPSA